MRKHRRQDKRRGGIAVLTALALVGLLAMMAFAIDVGYLYVTHEQLQNTADAAAMASCWELIDVDAPSGPADPATLEFRARAKADEFAAVNKVLQQAPQLAPEDVEVGYLANPSDPTAPLVIGGVEPPNAVRVRVRRSQNVNGAVPLFFARVLGINEASTAAEATAAMLTNIAGFRTPPRGQPLGMLPFALDEETCNQMLAGNGTDDWGWDANNEVVYASGDGVSEVNLYPQGTGSPGNRGTVDIGSDNNSTQDISRQITDGVNADDLQHHGGQLVLDSQGNLYLNGDTGISAGVKDELTSIIGKPRVLPIFREVNGNGNNAMYTIVGFVGVRLLEVKLTGCMSKKRVMIQPATMKAFGSIPAGGSGTSHFIYSPVWLVR